LGIKEDALNLHDRYRGKLSVNVKVPVNDKSDLTLIYSPGVAEPCKEIFDHKERIYDYTIKGNLVGIVTNGTAVLGLGNIGPEAAMPVMEGKAALFKLFAGIDGVPICVKTNDVGEMVETIKQLEPTFGGINLEDIAAPMCFLIEERLKKEMNIPVFHDDQHGTAIVTAAGLINALKVVKKDLKNIKVVVNGAGAAGIAIVKLLLTMGVYDVIMCDSKGTIYNGRDVGMNPVKQEIARITNYQNIKGSLFDALEGADVFIGVSIAGVLKPNMVQAMNYDPIIFAMANPVPEIMPEEAKAAGAAVVGTGRSDFPNQVNNVLAFPGIFKGALDVHASEINEDMKLAAVYAIANLIKPGELHADYVIPSPMDKRVVSSVAFAVADAAVKSGLCVNDSKENVR
jgi:malate dehydrogenase (oxaloacetate-decarboxylating)